MQENTNWLEKVEKHASEIAQREGCWLYDIEFIGGRILRVYIDKEQGIGIEDCSNVSKGLNLILDVEDIVPGGRYSLEVSTPGLDRHLKHAWHFEKVKGQKVWLKTRQALENYGVTTGPLLKAKQLEAVVESANEEAVQLQGSENTIRIPINEIEKAKLVFEMKKNDKKIRGK